jgi:hypothetical protein
MDNGALSENFVDTVLSNRDLGHSLTALGFLLDDLNSTVSRLIDKYQIRYDDQYKAGRASLQSKAKSYLIDDNDPFTTFFVCSILLGPEIRIWEPETIWLSLQRRFNIDLSVQDRSELLAIFTVQDSPVVYYDGAVFKNVALAMGGFEPDPHLIEELTPNEVSWGAIAIELVRKFLGYNKEDYVAVKYDYEPKVYMAAVLHRNGFTVAPPPLKECQQQLDSLNKDGAELSKTQIEKIWDKLKKQPIQKLQSLENTDNPLEAQISKLADVLSFINAQCDVLKGHLTPLLKSLKVYLN